MITTMLLDLHELWTACRLLQQTHLLTIRLGIARATHPEQHLALRLLSCKKKILVAWYEKHLDRLLGLGTHRLIGTVGNTK